MWASGMFFSWRSAAIRIGLVLMGCGGVVERKRGGSRGRFRAFYGLCRDGKWFGLR